MKKVVKNVLGFVSLLIVLPFVVPAGLLVLAGLYTGRMLARLVAGGTDDAHNTDAAASNKWNNATGSLSLNCVG